MSALNDIFMETYKEIDKHCRDMFVDEKGLGRYIEEMKNIPDIGKYYHKAKSALSRLSEYNRIRNSLVYDVGTSYSDMVEQSDITWLVSFKNSLQNCTDPLSAYRRNKENRASKNAKNTNYIIMDIDTDKVNVSNEYANTTPEEPEHITESAPKEPEYIAESVPETVTEAVPLRKSDNAINILSRIKPGVAICIILSLGIVGGIISALVTIFK